MGRWRIDSFGHAAFRVVAATPGTWSARQSVHPRYRILSGGAGVIDLDVQHGGRIAERLAGIDPAELSATVAERSTLVRVDPEIGAAPLPLVAGAGPRHRIWAPVAFSGGSDGGAPGRADYATALQRAMEEPEPALIALPDLHRHLGPGDAAAVVLAAARLVDPMLDRMVVADAPEATLTAADATAWIDRFDGDPAVQRFQAFDRLWPNLRAGPERSLNHVVGARQQRLRDFHADLGRLFHVHDDIKPGCLRHVNIG